MKKYNVDFVNQNLIISVLEDTTVAKACEIAGFPLDLVCNGKGTCGKCKVEAEIHDVKSVVLACKTRIESSIKIYITENDYIKKANILESAIIDGFEFNPSVRKIYKDIKNIKKESAGEFLNNCDLFVLKKFSHMINQKECSGITFVEYENKIIDVQLNNTTAYLYGAAIDIGTTTVVVYIYDLNTGMLLKTYSNLNSQISKGADVVSRINYGSSKSGLDELNGKIIHTLNNMVARAEIELPFLTENMYNIILCGNSTMQHLFFGLRPDSLGLSPFIAITKDYIQCWGEEINLNCADRCKVIFLPLIGGFVGSDTTAVLLTLEHDGKNNLIIDLGTNGEIAAGNINNYYVASTACGPALEGGSIDCGMRGTVGAVEKFKIINDKLELKVIGDSEPAGICGSGIIDITAELLRYNIIDNTGRMISRDEFKELKPKSELNNNFETINGINRFVIYKSDDKSVYITQKDIRQIQLAKSSIYTGCMTLLKAYGKSVDEIDEIIVAGAFGNYIDIENAVYIGLLPNALSKIKSIGNGAGKGVSLFLLNKDLRKKCDKIAKNSTHYELANNEDFTEGYINNMNF
ncbi:MAG: ASKHA domain-containing protein [Sedimentibacter sp.]